MSRNAHNWRQYDSSNSNTNTNSTSGRSESEHSYETTATEHSYRPTPMRSDTCHGRVEGRGRELYTPKEDADRFTSQSARASVDTYASTSEEDLLDDFDDVPEYDVPQYQYEQAPADARATTPRDFADLFPTSKKISIRHDDSTIDGNMNLRVDTQIEERNHRKQKYTLFHLRMHDLRSREFSLRRYCRDSGREVCHSIRKYQKPPQEKRPVLQRASTALASLRHKPDSRPSSSSGLKRSDSGYESKLSQEDDESTLKTAMQSKGRALIPTNTIKLEFSNYAHIDVKRRGAKSSKRYSFEYWGYSYSWKRVVNKDDGRENVTYYLVRNDDEKHALAHISPVHLTREQADEELARGGWIPPSYMRITDESILKSDGDISDVVVASGLIALVDDSIKRRFHTKQSTQLHIPLMRTASFKMDMEYLGPKRLIDEVFNRSNRNRPAPKHQVSARRNQVQS